AYGVDLKYRTGFWGGKPIKTRMTELVSALSSLGVWVRLHYVYPYPHVDEVIQLMGEGKLLPYVDVPFQHANRRILKLMKRPADTENTLARIRTWRKICPELAIRSTFIAGFPGETDAEFEELLNFMSEAQLDRVGCFTYSAVEGAKANALPDPVAEEVKEERRGRLMQLQEQISAAQLRAKVGKIIQVIVDEVGIDGASARSSADAPDIDGKVYIKKPKGRNLALKQGEFTDVRVTDADAHDLWAEPVAA
ncbi:MAG: radical SAM protein, partial [Pseudomonadota bacterium]|nr:radical SAM protein [Pseudomonadota bacterium]